MKWISVFLCVISCVHAGKKKHVARPVSSYSVESISLSPRVFRVSNFLSDAECDHLIGLAKPMMARSTVVDTSGTSNGILDKRRTSEGAFFAKNLNDSVVKRIEERIYELTKMPAANGEQIQVLHYGVGAEYQPHFDYFSPDTPGGKACLARGGQRTITFIMYLNTPEAGGETVFPTIREAIVPKKGDALLFYNCLHSGQVDPMSFHGGAPVKAGEKWIATKWFREGEFN